MPRPLLITTGLGLTLVATILAGCNLGAFVGPRETTYNVKAQYYGLENKTIAVIVAADEYTLFRFPKAPELTARAVSSAIQGTVPGARLADPRQISQYQIANPWWVTLRYSQIAESLGVERLIIIDLAEYRTHEPGNTYIWRGVMSGNIAVVEADGDDPDDIAYTRDIGVMFPEEGSIGVLDESHETMQVGMLALFARNTARLFHDHQITQ